MKKIVYLISILLTLQFGLIAQEANSQTSVRDRITQIDAKIEQLRVDLHNERIDVENAEMQSQPMMYDNWTNYSSLMEEREKREHRVNQIKEQIHSLEKRKTSPPKKR